MYYTTEKLAIGTLYKCFGEVVADFPKFIDEQYRRERVSKLAEHADFVTAREDSGDIVGIIAFYMNDGNLCYISHVSVVASHKRRGIFSAMYQTLEQEAKREGYKLIRLEVRKDNTPAINGYKKQGFELESANDESLFMTKHIK